MHRYFVYFCGYFKENYYIMKAKLISICILFLLTFFLSSCFLKPKEHFNDHRGVYKDRGMTQDQKDHMEEMRHRKRHKKHHRRHKKHVTVHMAKENHRADAKKNKPLDDNSGGGMDSTAFKNIPTHSAPVDTATHIDHTQPDQNLQNNNTGMPDPNNMGGQNALPPELQPVDLTTGDQQKPEDKAAKKEKKKHKKKKPKETQ